jgi:ATP-dependent Clp protease ATP-binding subunit ClpC
MTPDSFTNRARRVMQLATHEARCINCEYVGTEHVLLGILKEGSSIAVNVLKSHAVDIRQVRHSIDRITGAAGDVGAIHELPLAPSVQRVISHSVEEARDLNHDRADAEHLLLGLLHDHETVAVQVLINLGVEPDRLRDELLELLRRGTWPE